MKNLTDLPEETSDEIREKIHCYFAESIHVENSIILLTARQREIKVIINELINKSARATLKKHGIRPVRISLG